MLGESEQGSGYRWVLKRELRTRQIAAKSQPFCHQKEYRVPETKQVTPRENRER